MRLHRGASCPGRHTQRSHPALSSAHVCSPLLPCCLEATAPTALLSAATNGRRGRPGADQAPAARTIQVRGRSSKVCAVGQSRRTHTDSAARSLPQGRGRRVCATQEPDRRSTAWGLSTLLALGACSLSLPRTAATFRAIVERVPLMHRYQHTATRSAPALRHTTQLVRSCPGALNPRGRTGRCAIPVLSGCARAIRHCRSISPTGGGGTAPSGGAVTGGRQEVQ